MNTKFYSRLFIRFSLVCVLVLSRTYHLVKIENEELHLYGNSTDVLFCRTQLVENVLKCLVHVLCNIMFIAEIAWGHFVSKSNFMSIRTNTTLKFLAKKIRKWFCQILIWKRIFCIFRCVRQSINWYANAILSFVVKIERNLKILKNLLADTETILLQMSVNWKFHQICQTWQKEQKEKTKIL